MTPLKTLKGKKFEQYKINMQYYLDHNDKIEAWGWFKELKMSLWALIFTLLSVRTVTRSDTEKDTLFHYIRKYRINTWGWKILCASG